MSVSVNIHPNLSDNNAEFDSLNKTCWLTITSDGTAVAIFGTQQQAEALKMIADIFNDAFGPAAKTCDEDQPAVAPVNQVYEG